MRKYKYSQIWQRNKKRNRLLKTGKPFDSDYALILDSDVLFPNNIIEQYLKYMKENVVMITPNILQNIIDFEINLQLLQYFKNYSSKFHTRRLLWYTKTLLWCATNNEKVLVGNRVKFGAIILNIEGIVSLARNRLHFEKSLI